MEAWSKSVSSNGGLWQAQARPRPNFWKSGDLEIQKIGVQKIEILKIQIRSARNVGKVWISRKKIFPAPFGAIPCHFVHGPEKSKKCFKLVYFPWWANGPYSGLWTRLSLDIFLGGPAVSGDACETLSY